MLPHSTLRCSLAWASEVMSPCGELCCTVCGEGVAAAGSDGSVVYFKRWTRLSFLMRISLLLAADIFMRLAFACELSSSMLVGPMVKFTHVVLLKIVVRSKCVAGTTSPVMTSFKLVRSNR